MLLLFGLLGATYAVYTALFSGIAPAQTAQLLYDLSDGVDLLLVIGR